MTCLKRTEATLRFFGDDLSPDEISRVLGATPTRSELKGKQVDYPKGSKRVAKRGSWRLHASSKSPGDLDSQIDEIFGKLNSDPEVWRRITTQYDVDLFCGLFMAGFNDGEVLSPKSMKCLGDRGVMLSLDIYDSTGDRT